MEEVLNVNHIELAVVLDCEQIHLTAVLRKVLRNNSAPLSASHGSNPAQSPVVIGFNPALLLPIKSGCNPATLSASFGHRRAPLPAMIGQIKQHCQFKWSQTITPPSYKLLQSSYTAKYFVQRNTRFLIFNRI